MLRINSIGQEYHLTEVAGGKTLVTTQNKSITVDHPIEKLDQAWYHWMMKSMFIQDAFGFLTAGEREFLLTGITEEEWSRIFNDKEDE